MKKKNNFLKNILFFVIIIFIVLIFLKLMYLKECRLNGGLKDEIDVKSNHVIFFNWKGEEVKKISETNGLLLLELNLEKSLKYNNSENIIKKYGRKKAIGWWPDKEMQNGKYYFEEPLYLYYDSSNTGMIYLYYGDFIGEKVIMKFLTNDSMKKEFQKICEEINCRKDYIIRMWSGEDWKEDLDILAISSFISRIDKNDSFDKEVFDENMKLINFIIENKKIENYFGYVENDAHVYFLILYFDRNGNEFLSEKSRELLLDRLKSSLKDLEKPVTIVWGKGEKINGCKIEYSNERIPILMKEYAKKNWNITMEVS